MSHFGLELLFSLTFLRVISDLSHDSNHCSIKKKKRISMQMKTKEHSILVILSIVISVQFVGVLFKYKVKVGRLIVLVKSNQLKIEQIHSVSCVDFLV